MNTSKCTPTLLPDTHTPPPYMPPLYTAIYTDFPIPYYSRTSDYAQDGMIYRSILMLNAQTDASNSARHQYASQLKQMAKTLYETGLEQLLDDNSEVYCLGVLTVERMCEYEDGSSNIEHTISFNISDAHVQIANKILNNYEVNMTFTETPYVLPTCFDVNKFLQSSDKMCVSEPIEEMLSMIPLKLYQYILNELFPCSKSSDEEKVHMQTANKLLPNGQSPAPVLLKPTAMFGEDKNSKTANKNDFTAFHTAHGITISSHVKSCHEKLQSYLNDYIQILDIGNNANVPYHNETTGDADIMRGYEGDPNPYNLEYNVLYPKFGDTAFQIVIPTLNDLSGITDHVINPIKDTYNTIVCYLVYVKWTKTTLVLKNVTKEVINLITQHTNFGIVYLCCMVFPTIMPASSKLIELFYNTFHEKEHNSIECLNRHSLAGFQIMDKEISDILTDSASIHICHQINKYISDNYVVTEHCDDRKKASVLFKELEDYIKKNISPITPSTTFTGLHQKFAAYLKSNTALKKKRYSDGIYYYGLKPIRDPKFAHITQFKDPNSSLAKFTEVRLNN